MSGPFMDRFRAVALGLLLALGAGASGRADELADFHTAVAHVSAECRSALEVLETRGPGETAAAVSRLRKSWQLLVQRFGAQAPTGFDQQEHTTAMVDMDMRLVGALIIIDAGRQDAARKALNGIEEILSDLEAKSQRP